MLALTLFLCKQSPKCQSNLDADKKKVVAFSRRRTGAGRARRVERESGCQNRTIHLCVDKILRGIGRFHNTTSHSNFPTGKEASLFPPGGTLTPLIERVIASPGSQILPNVLYREREVLLAAPE